MNEHLRAIETVFSGYRFRSRLEARWAVFLTALNVRFEYEHEGFSLGGIRYLPDFWLPDSRTFLEIKPRRGDSVDRKPMAAVLAAPELFAPRAPDEHRMVIAYGDPLGSESDRIRMLGDEPWVSTGNGLPRVCPGCREIRFGQSAGTIGGQWSTHCACGSTRLPDFQAFVADAAIAARQARFEHGETPEFLGRVEHRYHDMSPLIYLAGKVRGEDWRASVGVPSGEPNESGGDCYRVGGLIQTRYGAWKYNGPDLSLQHGQLDHGVVRDCIRRVLNSNTLFVWIDQSNVHGTMAELGAWVGLGGGQVYGHAFVGFASQDLLDEVWFADSLSACSVVVPTARQAFDAFIEWNEYQRCYQSVVDAR